MASRHDIIHIDFEANAGKVSPALKAIQNSAIDTRKAVEGVEAELKKLEHAGADSTAIEAKRKELRGLQRDVKSLEQAEREYVKGIGTLDKAIKAFNDGTLSQMSAAFQKAAFNAAKLAQTKLVPSDKDYKKSMEELNTLMQRTQENVSRSRMQTDELLKAIESGGKVSANWLRTEKQNLEELLDVIPRGTAEWKQYNDQLTAIKTHVQTLSETERRLAGEIVDANDARRMANQLTREGAESAAREREAAQITISQRERNIEKLEQERQERVKSAQALSKQVADEANEIELKQQAIAELEKQIELEKASSETKKKEAEDARSAADTLKQAAAEETKNLELQRKATEGAANEVARLKGEIEKMNAEPVKPKVDTSEIEELRSRLERVQQMRVTAQEKLDSAKAVVGDVDRPWKSEKVQKALKEDRIVQEENVAKLEQRWQEYWEKQEQNAREFAAILNKTAIDDVNWAEFYTHVTGPNAEQAKSWYRVQQRKLNGIDYWGEDSENYKELTLLRASKRTNSADDGMLEELKLLESLKRKWEEYQRALNKARESSPKYDAAYKEMDDARTEIVQQERLIEAYDKHERQLKEQIATLEKATQAQQQSADTDKQKVELQQQLKDAEEKHAQELGHLEQQQKNTDEATTKAAKADELATQKEQELAAATGETAKKLEEERKTIADMESAHDGNIKKLQKEQQALQEYDDQIQQEANTMQQAEVQKAQSQELTVKKMEEIVAMLEKENHDTIPANTEKWKENKNTIDELTQKIKETKGEWMSYAEAEEYAQKIGTDDFVATTQQLQQATQALERQRDALIKTIQERQRDGQATADEEEKLKRVTDNLKKMKFEMDNANMSSRRMHEILNNPSSAKNLDELAAAVKRSSQELKLMEETIGKDNKAYKEMAEQTKNAAMEQKKLESQFKATASTFEKAWSRLKTYVGLYVGAAVAMQKLTSTMGDMMELSDKMGEVRKTTGWSADEVGRLSDNLKKLDVRTSIVGLLDLSAAAGQLGLKTQEAVEGFTKSANMLTVALPEMGREAATSLMKIADATGDLKKNGGDVEETLQRVGSTIIALRANSASAAPAITDFVSRVGAVGAQAGISIDQIAALGSTIDALGGRVEMSATALSRMIPAIRNNAFGVANAIGVPEKMLTDLFNQGKAMEAMVLIFEKMSKSVKRFDTSTSEGTNAMADNVEALLGKNAAMGEVMKELNQQGARAGIVFGLLSQNVDKLKEQLGTASDAYSKNTALLNEFNNMNETAAAKWARLKNQLEEMFVSDSAQRFLGWIIEKLRMIVDIISMEGPLGSAIRYMIVAAGLFRIKWTEAIGEALMAFGKWILAQTHATAATTADTAATAANTAAKTANTAATTTLANATEGAAVKTNIFTAAWGKMDKAMKANIIGLVATAVVWLGLALYNSAQNAKKAAKQMDVLADVEKKAKEESIKERAELEKLYKVTQDQTNSMEERKKALRDMVGDEKYKEYYENLSSENELAMAAAGAYKELSEQILATARARALDAKAEELQRKRIKLEDQITERKEWEDENREKYRKGKQAYEAQNKYVDEATRGMAGFPEAGVAQRGAAGMKPGIIDEFEGSIRERNRIDGEIEQIDKDLERLKKQVDTIKPQVADTDSNSGGGGGGGDNPYGTYNRVTSSYDKWDADSLVARRKEMLERVRALANGADVQKVLSEDAKFITEATRQNIKTTRDAIEWYNTERLKIQDALHEKHLTNTGDWLDPKKAKGRKKLLRDEWRAYLEELDAYYTERKTRIQEAGTEDGITEAEVRNRTLANEMEWHQRRAELQKLYADKSAEVTEEEQQAIFDIIAERTEDSAEMVQKTIGKTVKFMQKIGEKSPIELQEALAKLGLGWERDFLKQQNAVTQQMKAIQDIIDKERPFNGITRNLRENLVTMGILTADMTEERNRLMKEGEDMADFNARQAAEEIKRTAFMIGEAENAYSLTIEDVMRHMADAGMQAWADELKKNPAMQEGLMAQLRSAYDAIQDAIKKEASLIKKQTDIWWSDIEQGQTESRKGGFEKMISRLGLQEDQVKRANQLIGAGVASERVADKLAIKQMRIRLSMQAAYYAKMRQIGEERIRQLEAQGKLEDAAHLRRSLNLATTEELKKLEEQRVAIANQMEESENRLYTELRDYADLIYQSMQSVFEASHSADADYYNELAKLNLTGKGGPGAGTYVVIEDAGTSSATAHYEQLDERQALERHREIEQHNAVRDAWKKLMDDLNKKMNDTITDQINAMLQNTSIDANTAALNNVKAELGSTAATVQSAQTNLDVNTSELQTNTEALAALTERIGELGNPEAGNGGEGGGLGNMLGDTLGGIAEEGLGTVLAAKQEEPGSEWWNNNWNTNGEGPANGSDFFAAMNEQLGVREQLNEQQTEQMLALQDKVVQSQKKSDKEMTTSAQSAFAKMTQAANLYGVAYQAMSNDNMSASQKFGMIAIQAAGQAAITSLTVGLTETGATTAKDQPAVLSKLWKQLGWGAIPVYALFTGLLGGLMGLAASKVGQAKSEIAQATGVGNVASGRLSTGMLTYAEGNVNEFTSPASLQEGRQYNVDAADGKTYRARYMGNRPKTHITSGPEFHLAGERGREMIIDAGTTRQITMNDGEIWHAIQTLSAGGRLQRSYARRGRGVAAFAGGNVDDFDAVAEAVPGMDMSQMKSLQESIDRQSDLLEDLRINGIKATFDVYGKGGLVDSYDQGKKTVTRYGQRY